MKKKHTIYFVLICNLAFNPHNIDIRLNQVKTITGVCYCYVCLTLHFLQFIHSCKTYLWMTLEYPSNQGAVVRNGDNVDIFDILHRKCCCKALVSYLVFVWLAIDRLSFNLRLGSRRQRQYLKNKSKPQKQKNKNMLQFLKEYEHSVITLQILVHVKTQIAYFI